jgi:ribosomal protein S20
MFRLTLAIINTTQAAPEKGRKHNTHQRTILRTTSKKQEKANTGVQHFLMQY